MNSYSHLLNITTLVYRTYGIVHVKLYNGTELVPLTGTHFTTPVKIVINTSKVFEGFNIKRD